MFWCMWLKGMSRNCIPVVGFWGGLDFTSGCSPSALNNYHLKNTSFASHRPVQQVSFHGVMKLLEKRVLCTLHMTHRNDKLTTSITAEALKIFHASISRFGDISFYLKHSVI